MNDLLLTVLRQAQFEKAAGEFRALVSLMDFYPQCDENGDLTQASVQDGLRRVNVEEIVEKCIKELQDEVY